MRDRTIGQFQKIGKFFYNSEKYAEIVIYIRYYHWLSRFLDTFKLFIFQNNRKVAQVPSSSGSKINKALHSFALPWALISILLLVLSNPFFHWRIVANNESKFLLNRAKWLFSSNWIYSLWSQYASLTLHRKISQITKTNRSSSWWDHTTWGQTFPARLCKDSWLNDRYEALFMKWSLIEANISFS